MITTGPLSCVKNKALKQSVSDFSITPLEKCLRLVLIATTFHINGSAYFKHTPDTPLMFIKVKYVLPYPLSIAASPSRFHIAKDETKSRFLSSAVCWVSISTGLLPHSRLGELVYYNTLARPHRCSLEKPGFISRIKTRVGSHPLHVSDHL